MKTISFSSLRLRLGALVLLAVLPVLGLAVYTDLEEREFAISNIEETVQRITQYAASAQEQLIEGTRQILVAISKLPEVKGEDADICRARLAGFLEEYPQFANLGAIRPDGELFCSAGPYAPTEEHVSFSEQQWFQHTAQTHEFAIGGYQISRVTGKAVLHFSYPVVEAGDRLVAVVFASLDLEKLNQLTGQVQLPERAEFILMAQSGTILAYLPEPEKWVGKSIRDAPIVKAILREGQDVTEVRGLDGVLRLYDFTPLRSTVETGLYVSVGVPISAAFAEANKILVKNLIGLGGVCLLVLAAVWFGGNVFILRRVKALVGAAQRLTAGDMQARIGQPYGDGELDRLAFAFDEMADALEERAVQLRQAEAKYRTLVEQMPAITYTARLDDVRTPIYISPQVESMLGFTPQEWLLDPILWMRQIHPEDQGQVISSLSLTCGNPQKVTFSAEYRLFTKDRRRLWINDDALVVYDEDGTCEYLQGIMRDITDEKEAAEALRMSEERFRLLVESVKDYAIFMLDPKGLVASWNIGSERIKGYSSEEILGRHYSVFFTSEDGAAGVPAMELEAARREGWFENEGWRVRRDGSRLWANVILTSLYDKHARLIGFSQITRDLTAHKEAEEKLVDYQKQLRSLASQLSLAEEHERRRIATDLHDRVGQSLAISKIKLGALKGAAPNDEFVASIDEVRRLIEVAIQDTRSLIFKISSPILYELGFEAALEWLTEQIQKQHDIAVSFDDDKNVKPLDEDIRILLFQAASELLVNVAKHSQARHVKVSIGKGEDHVRVVVEDDGIGFDPSQIGARWDRTEGFGLFSIRERLNHVNGRLEIDSHPGRGTRVDLIAPLRKDDDSEGQT